MRAKLVVFPIRGRNWCFIRSIDPSSTTEQFSNVPSTFKDLFTKIFASPSSSDHKNKLSQYSKLELTIDFVSNKMNGAWSNLEKAPEGSVKKKIHGVGLKLLSRVKPSEIFFKSIPKEVNGLEIIYPPRNFNALQILSHHATTYYNTSILSMGKRSTVGSKV